MTGRLTSKLKWTTVTIFHSPVILPYIFKHFLTHASDTWDTESV